MALMVSPISLFQYLSSTINRISPILPVTGGLTYCVFPTHPESSIAIVPKNSIFRNDVRRVCRACSTFDSSFRQVFMTVKTFCGIRAGRSYRKKILLISFPRASTMINNRIIMPNTCARIRNLSLGLCRVTISYIENITCPPSNAGMGNKFRTASMIDNNAVTFQNLCQSHDEL